MVERYATRNIQDAGLWECSYFDYGVVRNESWMIEGFRCCIRSKPIQRSNLVGLPWKAQNFFSSDLQKLSPPTSVSGNASHRETHCFLLGCPSFQVFYLVWMLCCCLQENYTEIINAISAPCYMMNISTHHYTLPINRQTSISRNSNLLLMQSHALLLLSRCISLKRKWRLFF